MNCICCGSEAIKFRANRRGFQIYTCDNCDFEFVHPLPEKETLESHYYATRVDEELKKRIISQVEDLATASNFPKRDWFDKVLAKVTKKVNKDQLRILEIGSGLGSFVHYASTKGHDIIGTESTAAYAHAGKGIIEGEIRFNPNNDFSAYFDGEKVDLIYMEHVLEHVTEPQSLLENLRLKLTPSGVLFIAVPNHKSFLAKLRGVKWKWTNPPEHLYYYNAQSLKTLLKNNGFKVDQVWTADHYFRSIPQFYSLTIFRNKFVSLSNKVLKTNFKKKPFSYKYPRSLGMVLELLPFWLIYPFQSLIQGPMGKTELILMAQPASPGQ